MEPGALFFLLACIGVVGGYASTALGKRIGDEMAAWVIANDEDGSPAPEFGADVGERHRRSLGRYHWYARQYRQLKRARSEPPTLANQFFAVQTVQVIGTLVLVIAGLWAGMLIDSQQ
jgi:hypothetical protein